jgi:hypothetical protein
MKNKNMQSFKEFNKNLNTSNISESKIFPKEITLIGTNGPGKKITYELFILPKSYWKNEKPAYKVIKPKGLDDVYYYDNIDFENKKLNNY